MTKFKHYFFPTPFDLNMQSLTLEEIVDLMKPSEVDQNDLPYEFATLVSRILAADRKSEDRNKSDQS